MENECIDKIVCNISNFFQCSLGDQLMAALVLAIIFVLFGLSKAMMSMR